MFTRRLSVNQSKSVTACYGTYGCPDLWELENGDFAVIGADMTDCAHKLPAGGCGPNERIVRIPRALLIHSKPNIPDTI